MQACEALLRLSSTPTPFVYRHLLAVMMFSFVYSFPFAYAAALGAAVIPVSYMMCFALYGVARLSHELENGLGFHSSSLDLEGFLVRGPRVYNLRMQRIARSVIPEASCYRHTHSGVPWRA